MLTKTLALCALSCFLAAGCAPSPGNADAGPGLGPDGGRGVVRWGLRACGALDAGCEAPEPHAVVVQSEPDARRLRCAVRVTPGDAGEARVWVTFSVSDADGAALSLASPDAGTVLAGDAGATLSSCTVTVARGDRRASGGCGASGCRVVLAPLVGGTVSGTLACDPLAVEGAGGLALGVGAYPGDTRGGAEFALVGCESL